MTRFIKIFVYCCFQLMLLHIYDVISHEIEPTSTCSDASGDGLTEGATRDPLELAIQTCFNDLDNCMIKRIDIDPPREISTTYNASNGCEYTLIDKVTWGDAKTMCNKSGGALATRGVRSCIISKLITQHLHFDRAWVGLRKVGQEWKWIDDEIEPDNSSRWRAGEPNNSENNEKCVHLNSSNARLNDENCNSKRKALCEKNCT